jgi:hypothetical protein
MDALMDALMDAPTEAISIKGKPSIAPARSAKVTVSARRILSR